MQEGQSDDHTHLDGQFIDAYDGRCMDTFARLAASHPSYLRRARITTVHIMARLTNSFFTSDAIPYLQCLIHHGANVNAIIYRNNDRSAQFGDSPLFRNLLCIRKWGERNNNANLAAVRMFLNAGVIIEPPVGPPSLALVVRKSCCSDFHNPVLTGCCCRAVMELLVKAGADLDAFQRYMLQTSQEVENVGLLQRCLNMYGMLPARRLAARRACILLLAKTRARLLPQRDIRVMLARMVWESRWDEEWDDVLLNKK